MIHRAAAAAIGLLLLTVGYIDLELSLDLPGWHANAPVADACALALLGLALTRGRAAWRDVPQPRAWAAFLAVGALSAASTTSGTTPTFSTWSCQQPLTSPPC